MQFAYPLHIRRLRFYIRIRSVQNSHDRHYSIDNPFCQLERFHSNHVLEIRIYRGEPLDMDRAIVYTYRSAIEWAGISMSCGKCSKRSHFDGESLPANHEFSGKYGHYRDFVRFLLLPRVATRFSRDTMVLRYTC